MLIYVCKMDFYVTIRALFDADSAPPGASRTRHTGSAFIRQPQHSKRGRVRWPSASIAPPQRCAGAGSNTSMI